MVGPGGPRRRSISPTTALTGAVIAGLLAGGAAWALKPAPSANAPVTRLSLALPDGAVSANPEGPNLDISADGRNVVFAARVGGVTQLVLRALDRITGQTLPGTDGARSVLLTRREIDRVLRTRPAANDCNPIAGDQGRRRRAIRPRRLVGRQRDHLLRARQQHRDHEGAERRWDAICCDDAGSVEGRNQPSLAPGAAWRQSDLLTVWTGPARDNKAIQVLKLDTGSRETVANGGDTGRYVRSGHVLFGRLDP